MLCAMFHAKQTMFELFYTRKCQKWVKKPKNSNLEHKFKHMTIVSDFNHFHKIIYTKLCLVTSFKQNKPRFNHLMRENAKKA